MSGPEGSSTKTNLLGAQDHLVSHRFHGHIHPAFSLMFNPHFAPSRSLLPAIAITILSGSVLLTLLAGCGSPAQTVTIIDDGVTLSVTGEFAAVGEALAAADITLNPADDVAPGADAPLDGETTITIDRAQAVQLLSADGERTVWTQAETLGALLAEADIPVGSTDRLLADNVEVEVDDVAGQPLPAQLIIDPYKSVTLVLGEESSSLRTAARSVGEALAEAGVEVGPHDTVTPSLEAELTPDLIIEVERAAPYRLIAGGLERAVSSGSTRVADILAEAGVALAGLDRVQPPEDTTVQPGDVIRVIRVTEGFETTDEPIPYDTVYQADETLALDTQTVASTGSPGVLRRQTRILYEDGVEVSREPAGEWVAVEPVNDVVNYGTQISVRTMDTPEGPIEYWRVVNMRVTAYTPSSAGKSPGEPGYGITASGRPAGIGVVAIDPRVVPFRSNVYVPGYGIAFAGDTGGGVKGRFIDLGYSDDNYQHWSGFVDVYYLTPVPAADRIRYILP